MDRTVSGFAKLRRAFTLIELLVVVTIIVILLALLVPVLDRAIRSAEMAKCGANLYAISHGVISYAAGNKRSYPYRSAVQLGDHPFVMVLARFQSGGAVGVGSANYDDRPLLSQYMSIDAFQDPLADEANLKETPAGILVYFSNYTLMFGMKYVTKGGTTMDRSGRKMNYDGQKSSALAGDLNVIGEGGDEWWGRRVWSSHPDEDGKIASEQFEKIINGAIRGSWYSRITDPPAGEDPRGTVDNNFTFQDGSVQRYDKLEWDDNDELGDDDPRHGQLRMLQFPVHRDTENGRSWLQVPNEGSGH